MNVSVMEQAILHTVYNPHTLTPPKSNIAYNLAITHSSLQAVL